jgi:hypothetical protein
MVYLAINSGGTAQPLAYTSSWTVNFAVAKVDVTALGDTNLVWVSGLPDATGEFSGFYDTATSQTYQASVDGQPRNFYLYPSLLGLQGANPGQYFFGTILPDFSTSGGVAAAVTFKSAWNAASQVQRYPALGIAGT